MVRDIAALQLDHVNSDATQWARFVGAILTAERLGKGVGIRVIHRAGTPNQSDPVPRVHSIVASVETDE